MEISIDEFEPTIKLTAEDLQEISRTRIAEQKFREEVIERDGGRCLCGRPGVDVHHVLGRDRFRGQKDAPEALRTAWPHAPPHGIMLCKAHHEAAHKYGKIMKPLLLAWILYKYYDVVWENELYNWWLSRPPFGSIFGWDRQYKIFASAEGG